MMAVPEELLTRFRSVAMHRLEQIDEAWHTLVRGQAKAETERDLLRDVHTLKGDAKVLGMAEASLLCQRLEDLLEAAHEKGYRVHDDVDVVVTMTIQFIGMLVRKQSSARRGIDLDGFLKQIEQVMSEWLRRSSEAPERPLTVGPHLRMKDHEQLTKASDTQLSSSTTAVFLEHIRSDPSTGERLREVWLSLLSGVLNAHSAPLATVFFGHAATVRELAVDLGRRVHVEVAGETLTVTQQTASVVGTLLVHALRNAVDHGIETPAIRTSKGKNPIGEIRISAARDGELVTIEVSDDGAGLDVERTRKRAIERGILSADLAPIATAEQLSEFLFTPGFSTREVPSDVSGRGIGLDAAKAAVVGHGGSLEIRANAGKGTTLVAVLPDIRGTLNVICFGGVTGSVRFAVSSDFTVKRTDAAPTVSFETILRLPSMATGDISLEIAGSKTSFVVSATGTPTAHRALRRCPTPNTDLAEVIWVDGDEVILIRPELIGG